MVQLLKEQMNIYLVQEIKSNSQCLFLENLSIKDEIQYFNPQLTYLRIVNIKNNDDFIQNLILLCTENKKLTKMTIKSCDLSKIPKEIGKLTELSVLNLSDNKIKTLPESVGNLQNLENLNVAHNRLSNLPEQIKNLKKLCNVDISYNYIKNVGDIFEESKDLIKVKFHHNPLETIFIFNKAHLEKENPKSYRHKLFLQEMVKTGKKTYKNREIN